MEKGSKVSYTFSYRGSVARLSNNTVASITQKLLVTALHICTHFYCHDLNYLLLQHSSVVLVYVLIGRIYRLGCSSAINTNKFLKLRHQ